MSTDFSPWHPFFSSHWENHFEENPGALKLAKLLKRSPTTLRNAKWPVTRDKNELTHCTFMKHTWGDFAFTCWPLKEKSGDHNLRVKCISSERAVFGNRWQWGGDHYLLKATKCHQLCIYIHLNPHSYYIRYKWFFMSHKLFHCGWKD